MVLSSAGAESTLNGRVGQIWARCKKEKVTRYCAMNLCQRLPNQRLLV